MSTFELRYYQTATEERPFVEWLQTLKDRQARTRVEARLARVAAGNLGSSVVMRSKATRRLPGD